MATVSSRPPPADNPPALTETLARLTGAALLLVNAVVVLQLAVYGRLQVQGMEVGDVVALSLALAGISLGLRMCSWPRSTKFGHWLVFLCTFGLFAALIPYVSVNWLLRVHQLRGVLEHLK